MQYEIHVGDAAPDVVAIERLLHDIDPAALLGLDAPGGTLRLSTSASDLEVSDVFSRAGLPLSPAAIVRLPSQCCGGCGG